MARKFYRYPPRPSSGSGTFSDNIVGLQLTSGGGLTQGNFEFTTSITEKVNRQFNIGAFSDPISLDSLQLNNLEESRTLIAKEFRVYPNFDLSEITKFNLYGQLTKRISVSVEKIINFFPAALEVYTYDSNFLTANTAYNIFYDSVENVTVLDIDVLKLNNPLEIDFSVNATRNLELRDVEVSPLRNLTSQFLKYSLFFNDSEYPLLFFTPSDSLYSGKIELTVLGNPFSGNSETSDYLIIRPNNFYVDKSFSENFDEVENFLMNRMVVPKYTATFKTPQVADDGTSYISYDSVTWPLDGKWNLDIKTPSFDSYIARLNNIAVSFDTYRTNLIVRFLTTDSFKEFDTPDQKIQKVLSLYGRSFDEVKKFIDALANMNSVNYIVKNDIPSQLLKNLSETLGWKVNMSPITNENFLDSVFGNNSKVQYPAYSTSQTPTELNYQYYRNLILNSAYLFKSKGTRRSIECLLRLVGAPDALIEFNEHIYAAGQRINMGNFDKMYAQIELGSLIEEYPVYDSGVTFTILGHIYSGFTTKTDIIQTYATRNDYPVDDDGYPKSPDDTPDYFFQKGAGWFELVRDHQSPLMINKTGSVFTGQNYNIQTEFEEFTYGQKYLDRYRKFPYMNQGFKIRRTIDNRKSWTTKDINLRIGNPNSGYEAYYHLPDDRLALNVKNVELFLNPAQGIIYDVWYMSRKYNYPIPTSGLTSPYPTPGGKDWTFINPQPQKKSFFEFAQTFWNNTINVRNRLTITDGKTSGYPTLQSIYWKYLTSQQAIGVPNDNFTYKTMVDYVTSLGDYWIRLVEQMIPASTIWIGGVKFENSIFHRQKFAYRIQRGCNIVPVPCEPCFINTSLFPYDCTDETTSCQIYPDESFGQILYNLVLQYLIDNSIPTSCLFNNSNSLITDWYLILKVGNQTLINEKFYSGLGLVNVPTNQIWLNSLNQYLPDLINYGLNFYYQGNNLYVSNAGCDTTYKDKELQLNIGVDFKITCN